MDGYSGCQGDIYCGLRIYRALPLNPVYPFLLLCLDVGGQLTSSVKSMDNKHFSNLDIIVVFECDAVVFL